MKNNIGIKLHQASLPATLKGRICKPVVGIQDSAFIYTPAIRTDLAQTFKRAFSQIGERVTEKAA